LKKSGNSLFVVEHELDLIRQADWVVDVGPGAGQHGGQVLYSGPLPGLSAVTASETRKYVFAEEAPVAREPRRPTGVLGLRGVTRNNLRDLSVDFPLGNLTCVTGVSGSGKSTLVSQVLVGMLAEALGHERPKPDAEPDVLEPRELAGFGAAELHGVEQVRRQVVVDQKPIGRTPRSNLATYTGLFDEVRRLFAATPLARKRRYGASRFSFNVAQGRCQTCQGEGFVMVELLFLPSVYSPCRACGGTRYDSATLEVLLRGRSIADVLAFTVDDALSFFEAEPSLVRALSTLKEVGLGYLRLGQPATELSGGEAQRIKLATELQRSQRDGSVYVLDEPTTGLHPADVRRLMAQLQKLVDSGATVIVVEHDLQVIGESDHVIDLGPGAGDEGGQVVAQGPPAAVARAPHSRTAGFLRASLGR